jgi:hypothetical protein
MTDADMDKLQGKNDKLQAKIDVIDDEIYMVCLCAGG